MKFIYTYLSLLYEEDMPVFTYQNSRLRVVRSIKFFLILNTNNNNRNGFCAILMGERSWMLFMGDVSCEDKYNNLSLES